MARPPKERRIERLPAITGFKPAGIPMRNIDQVEISFEEMEAIRLADLEQLDQAAAAEKMNISRPTFNRLINRAHHKIATVLWEGKALVIEGGTYRIDHPHKNELRYFICKNCSHEWSVPHGTGQSGREMTCPECGQQEAMRTK